MAKTIAKSGEKKYTGMDLSTGELTFSDGSRVPSSSYQKPSSSGAGSSHKYNGSSSGGSSSNKPSGSSGGGGGSSSTSSPGYVSGLGLPAGAMSQKYTGGNTTLDAGLAYYSQQYAAAKAKGDASGMRSANDAANMLRNKYGYAAEYATSDTNSLIQQQGGGMVLGGGSSGSSGGSLIQPGGSGTGQSKPEYPFGFDSIEDLKDALGYDKQSEAEKAAIDAYIQQAVNSLNAQKSTVNQSADELARQAYIAYERSKNAMPQALAASGYSGGMADSQYLGLETGLQNQQNDIALNRTNSLNDIDTAINNTKLEGSIQGAQAQADLGRDAIEAFKSYMQQANAYANSDFWSKYGYDFTAQQDMLDKIFQAGQSQANRDWQSSESQADRDFSSSTTTQKQAYDAVWNMLLAGQIPSDDMLAAAGISRSDAEGYAALVQSGKSSKPSGGGGNIDNTPKGPEPTGDQGAYDSMADRFDAGDYSPEVIDYLLQYDSPETLAQVGGFVSRFLDLGRGPISQTELSRLIANGDVIAVNIGGNTYFKNKTAPTPTGTSGWTGGGSIPGGVV